MLDTSHPAEDLRQLALQARVKDMHGRSLVTTQVKSNDVQAVNLQELPQGLYMLELWENGRRV